MVYPKQMRHVNFFWKLPPRAEEPEGERGATTIFYEGPDPQVPGASAYPLKQGELAFTSAHEDSWRPDGQHGPKQTAWRASPELPVSGYCTS